MAENLYIAEGGKEERYAALLPQIESLISNETDETANMANVAAVISETFGFLWTGFYRVVGDTHKEGAWSMWHGLEGRTGTGRPRRRAISRPHRMQ